MPPAPTPIAARSHWLLLPLAALLATIPIFWHGYSCGHDFDFHLQSWVDAAQQFRHGALYPRWIFSAAYNAGEPRFIFYPPLSWMLGALLTLCLPIAAAPALYTFIALTAAGFAMHHLARHFVAPPAALLAATLYLANPYMLFNAIERAAYGELLAAAWMPLLLLAVWRERPTIVGFAVPVALLWLTNAPSAVMGCYLLAILVALRFLQNVVPLPFFSGGQSRLTQEALARLLVTAAAGTMLGLALPAFYLIPAAYERRYVQIALAIIPNMRFEDNFLFRYTTDEPHNEVQHTASLLALVLLVLTAAATIAVLVRQRRRSAADTDVFARTCQIPIALVIVAALVAFMLGPISTPLWRHLPDLAFLQFPWRLLTILCAVLAFAIALLLEGCRGKLVPVLRFAAPACALALGCIGIHLYRQPCDAFGRPNDVFALFNAHHGVLPTEEYTPNGARNDILRSDNPAYWLSPDPAAFAPDTTPNPGVDDPSFADGAPVNQTISAHAPPHLALNLSQPEILILNLRDFPDWRLTRNGQEVPAHLPRADGLMAIALPSGASTVDVTWRFTFDQQLGLGLSAGALVVLGLCLSKPCMTFATNPW